MRGSDARSASERLSGCLTMPPTWSRHTPRVASSHTGTCFEMKYDGKCEPAAFALEEGTSIDVWPEQRALERLVLSLGELEQPLRRLRPHRVARGENGAPSAAAAGHEKAPPVDAESLGEAMAGAAAGAGSLIGGRRRRCRRSAPACSCAGNR